MNATPPSPGPRKNLPLQLARSWLGLRLGLTITLIVLLTASAGMMLDFRRQYHQEIAEVFRSLRTVAYSIEPATRRLNDSETLSRALDSFLSRIEVSVAPHHHLVVFDPQGSVIVSVAHQGDLSATGNLSPHGAGQEIVVTPDGPMAVFRLTEKNGTVILAARDLVGTLADLRAEMRSRAIQNLIIAGEIILLILVAVRFWVLRPVKRLVQAARSWSDRDFAARVEPAGSPEFRELCREFNLMAAELADHEARRQCELGEARTIQARLMPGNLPKVMGLKVAAKYQPADQVGGDLFDVFSLSRGQVAAVVLDVAGHGISAALLTGVVKMSLRHHLLGGEDLLEAVKRVNGDMLASSPDERFVTLCVGVWNPADRTWMYVAAGHPGGIWLSGEHVHKLGSTGPVLGTHSENSWKAEKITLQPGDRLFLFSDGVLEAGAPERMLGMAGAADLLAASAHDKLGEQVDELARVALARQTNGFSDDLTILAMEVDEESEPAVLGA